MNKVLISIIVVIVLLGVGWYLTAQYNTDDTDTANTNTNTSESVATNEVVDEVEYDYSISMTEYKYSVTELSVDGPNETIMVQLTNDGSMPHDFIIDELNVNSGLVQPGDSTVVSITSGELANTYEFYCGVGNHRALGMFGSFTQ